mmetsp:Transcript_59326/g.111818  ORF Transcript_59326/g.111818 Transcript_59326/m.111818 type:complete len:97 (-) Transcript_59326:194-484(-)
MCHQDVKPLRDGRPLGLGFGDTAQLEGPTKLWREWRSIEPRPQGMWLQIANGVAPPGLAQTPCADPCCHKPPPYADVAALAAKHSPSATLVPSRDL